MEFSEQKATNGAQPQAQQAQDVEIGGRAAAKDTTPSAAVTVPVKFNHTHQDLPLARASELAQKGLQAETFLPKLQFLAALRQQSVAQWVEQAYTAEQEQTRQEYLQRVQDPELAEQLLQGRNQRVGRAYQALQKAQTAAAEAQAAKSRQAQWQQLQQAVPELTELPPQAEQIARQNGISLLDGYLRFRWQESQRIAAALAQQALASARSGGSQKSTATRGAELSAMLRGVWSR